jgi:hypothetical protein
MKFINKNQSILTLSVLALVAIGAFYVGRMHSQNQPISQRQSTSTIAATNDFPTLILSPTYFLNKDIIGEEVDTASPSFATASENNWPWTSATIDSEDNYQTYPTTTITLADAYSSEVGATPGPLGSMTSWYLPQDIVSIKQFDVEGDGTKETIVYLCNANSGDGSDCPHKIEIIKGNKIVFTISDSSIWGDIDLAPSDTGNGFYIHSFNNALRSCNACSIGYLKTRFVYENGVFKPIYEQTVYYLNVQNVATSTQ